MFDRRDVPIDQVLKMIMLYTLRFEQMQGNALEDFLRDLFRIGVEEERVEVCYQFFFSFLFLIIFLFFFFMIVDCGIEIVCRG